MVGITCKIHSREIGVAEIYDYSVPFNINDKNGKLQSYLEVNGEDKNISLWHDEELRKATREEIKKSGLKIVALGL